MTKLNRSIDRALDIIETLTTDGPSSLAHLARATQLPKATLIRLCATLENRRWVIKRSSDGCYQLGSMISMLAGQPAIGEQLVEAGKSEIARLSQDTGLAVDLAASIGNGRVEIVDTTRNYALHRISPDTISYRPSPFRTALGLGFLASMSSVEFSDIIPALAQSASRNDRDALEQLPKAFRNIRTHGFAERETDYWGRAVDAGNLPSAIGVGIRANGKSVGAINLVWAAQDQLVSDVVAKHLGAMKAAADRIGKNLIRGR